MTIHHGVPEIVILKSVERDGCDLLCEVATLAFAYVQETHNFCEREFELVRLIGILGRIRGKSSIPIDLLALAIDSFLQVY